MCVARAGGKGPFRIPIVLNPALIKIYLNAMMIDLSRSPISLENLKQHRRDQIQRVKNKQLSIHAADLSRGSGIGKTL